MKKLIVCAALAFAGVSASAVNADEYQIDIRGAHASITFRFKHLGISWLTGSFEKFSGSFTLDEDNPATASIVVDIDPASLNSNHAERDRHLRSADYLDVEKYPTARFESTRVELTGDDKATVYGNLTLHGQTREIAIDAALTGSGKDPWGGYRVGFEGVVTLDTMDFGIRMPPSNEVEMSLYLEGIRQ